MCHNLEPGVFLSHLSNIYAVSNAIEKCHFQILTTTFLMLNRVIVALLLGHATMRRNIHVTPSVSQVCPRDVYYIPKDWRGIEADAFVGCNKLTSVIIHDYVTEIGDGAFDGCTNLFSVSLGRGIESIGDSAFKNCTWLSEITIPQNVRTIGDGAFTGCPDLHVTVHSDNNRFMSKNGMLYGLDKNGVTLIHGQKLAYVIDDFVTSIGGSAFMDMELGHISLSKSLKKIGDRSFWGVTGLSLLELPDSLTYIGDYAFYASDVVNITIPKSVTEIGTMAFQNCKELTTVTFLNYLESISSNLFSVCSSLVTVTLPTSLRSIYHSAFYMCSNLTDITFPESLETIGDSAFEGCESLKFISLPKSVIEIGVNAFSFSTKVSVAAENEYFKMDGNVLYNSDSSTLVRFFGREILEMEVPDSVTVIGNYSFAYTDIASVTIANSVREIGRYAFCRCTSLTHIDLPESLVSIGGGAFSESGLVRITLPKNLVNIGNHIFQSCPLGNVTFDNPIEVITMHMFEDTALTRISLPESVEIIDSRAFFGSNLEVFEVPKYVNFIGDDAFGECTLLEKITVHDNEHFKDIDGVLFSSNGSKLIQFPCARTGQYEIPESVQVIYSSTFAMSKIESVVIPNSIKEIPDTAFDGCTCLRTIIIPNSVTYMGHGIFSGCRSLMTITIPNSLKRIEAWSFTNCTSLTTIVIPDSVEEIGWDAFSGCTSLTTIVIPDSVKMIGDSAFYGCTSLTNVSFYGLDEPTYDGNLDDIFYGCPDELKVDVPFEYKDAIFLGRNIRKVEESSSTVSWHTYVLISEVVVLILVEFVMSYVKTPSIKTEVSDEQPRSKFYWLETAGLYVWAFLIVLSLLFISYIGFTVFFYCALLILFTPLTTGFSYIASMDGFGLEFTQLITWFIYAIPFISLLLSINYQLFSRFFTNYTGIFNLSRVVKYLRHQFKKSRMLPKIITMIGLCCLPLIGVCVVVLLILGQSVGTELPILIIGLVAIAGPISALFKVTFQPWIHLISMFSRYRREKHFIEDVSHTLSDSLKTSIALELTESYTAGEDESITQSHTKTHHMSLSDPFGIRNQDEWIRFLESDSSLLMGIRGGLSKGRLITLVVFLVISLLYISLDIAASIRRINYAKHNFEEDAIRVGYLLTQVKEDLSQAGSEIPRVLDMTGIAASLRKFANSLTVSSAYPIICCVIRIILELYLLPFVVSANIFSILSNWKKLAKEKIVRVSQCVYLGFVALCIILFSIWGGICGTIEWNKFPPGYIPESELIRIRITDDAPVGICNQNLGHWKVMELATMTMLSDLKTQWKDDVMWLNMILDEFLYERDEEVEYQAIRIDLMYGTDIYEKITSLETSADVWYKGEFKNGVAERVSLLYAFGGLTSHRKLSFMIENVVKYWFDVLITSLIPFFSVIRPRVMNSFLEPVAGIVDDVIIGFETYTESNLRDSIFWASALKSLATYFVEALDFAGLPIAFESYVSGHSSGGLIAKAFAAAEKLPVVAFESPAFEHSKSYDVLFRSQLFSSEQGNVGMSWENLINIYSSGSLFSAEETNATANLKYPSLQSMFEPANSYQTFCQIAAGCAEDDRYDRFCSHAVGRETFLSYFDLWKRRRYSDDD